MFFLWGLWLCGAMACQKAKRLEIQGGDLNVTRDPKLEVNARSSKTDIVLQYTLTNQSDKDLLVFSALYKLGPDGPVIEPNMVYTLVDGDVLTIAKAVLPIKHGIQVEIPSVPYAVKLAGGKALKETITVPLPVPYYNPHDLVLREETLTCKRVRLRLGFAPLAKLAPAPQVVRLNGQEYFRVNYRTALDCQQVMEAQALEAPMSVHKRP
jgi:hypothetical protein